MINNMPVMESGGREKSHGQRNSKIKSNQTDIEDPWKMAIKGNP
jgi:hypothetical protein